ncbi:MAG TPA: universal stress protein [Casimicrobiaceae bacterium]|nr:universal stress protein [Casimicrobiaceae bacterium]
MATSYNRLLLASEGTEFDVGAERVAVDLAEQWQLRLLAVIPVVSNPEFEVVAPQLAERAEAAAASHLERLRAVASQRGVELDGTVRLGETPYLEIVAEARERNADLIVLRRRGKRGFLANLLVGAMTHTVIGHAPCDVLIVPRAARMWSRGIVLATDGSVHSARAAEAAAGVALRSSLPVTVVCVLAHPQDDRGRAMANVEAATALLRTAGARADGRTAEGKPHEAILDAARGAHADLIVVGRRGLGGVERLLLGSTSERVSGFADCAVLIVRA